jgi:tetratricopeptide (TPR) repeat protein
MSCLRKFPARLLGLLLSSVVFNAVLQAADWEDAQKLFLKGDYDQCIRQARQAIEQNNRDEEWRLLLAETFLVTGQYTNALAVVTTNLDRYSSSIQLRLLANEVFRRNGRAEDAQRALMEINELVQRRPWSYRDPRNLVALGRAVLRMGADPKVVLQNIIDRAKKLEPTLREPYLAAGEIALEKNDYQLAADTFSEALKKFPTDPDFHYGLARAYAPNDRAQLVGETESALDANPKHVPSLLLVADHMIDAEEYSEAEKFLKRVFEVNPNSPDAWAYRAVLAHLRSDVAAEKESRANALLYWNSNPEVDYLIGRKLALKYRFAEAAASQRLALRRDPEFVPAKIQLAEDLLRLGEEEEGWRLANEVHHEDGYDITAYNLTTLEESLSKFTAVTNAHFIIRMSAHEAELYGKEALELLERAREKMTAKYGAELQLPTLVEIFPDPKDFAVRTFGIPGNPGYLGVCFGRVITANSPASQAAHPANWQAVLWHEFCHVITLTLTHNKMPRWLSEGISVYEERQADPAWGQSMSPRYREMILGDDFVPIGDLSAAFLTAKSGLHLQFAYFESCLVVDFIVQKYGIEALKNILKDLGEGVEINKTLSDRTVELSKLEQQFLTFARDRARNLAPGLDFARPDPELMKNADALLESGGPDNFYRLSLRASRALSAKKFEAVKEPAKRLIELFPGYSGEENGYVLLAAAHRHLGETNLEKAVLEKYAPLTADDLDALRRLTELTVASGEWSNVVRIAEKVLAVNPLIAPPRRARAEAGEKLNQPDLALREYAALLRLDPPDPAWLHFRRAALLDAKNDGSARDEAVMALEEAPRFRDAYLLLRKWDRTRESGKPEPAAEPKNQ